jgi:ornithine carbamoyltransferase
VAEGVAGCDVIHSDIWVSMGKTVDFAERARPLSPYRITADVMTATGNERAIFRHCLPALYDDQTEAGRIPTSRKWMTWSLRGQ